MNESTRELLVNGAREMGINLSPEQVKQFELYREELIAWNRVVNLTGLEDSRDITIKHFIDSLSLARAVEVRGDERVIDVGTGAGFPGLAVKIWQPGVNLCLLEAAGKPVKFLHYICNQLKLTGVEVIHGRAEKWGREAGYREEFDVVLARAVAPLPVVLEYGLPFLRRGGWMVAFKGPRVYEEISRGKEACMALGGEMEKTLELSLPFGGGERVLIVVKKVTGTPAVYPRRAGLPARRPLGKNNLPVPQEGNGKSL